MLVIKLRGSHFHSDSNKILLSPTRNAIAFVWTNCIHARSVISTWLGWALIDIFLTVVTLKSCITYTREWASSILAWPTMFTRIWQTIVNVLFAKSAIVAVHTNASKTTNFCITGCIILTRWRRAFVNFYFAISAAVTFLAVARIAVDSVFALATICTRIGGAVVDIFLA